MWFEHDTSRIYFEDSGSGTPILLLPGAFQTFDELSALRGAFFGAGYRVITADLPGSGRSLPQPREYTASYYEDDAMLFSALLDHLSTRPAYLIGFSDGGEVALLMAILKPELARAVVTWGAAGMISDPGGMMRNAMSNIVDNPIPPMRGFRDYLVSNYGEDLARIQTRNFARGISDIIDSRGGDISLSKVNAIACPVLLITGEYDMFAPPSLLFQLAEQITNVETHVVDGSGHAVNAERPEWLSQTILDWLSRH